MRFITISVLLLGLLTVSCKSEYHERLDEAKELKAKMSMVQASNELSPRERLEREIQSLNEEILFLAKVSGNEELFLQELYED